MQVQRFFPNLPTYIVVSLFFAFALWSIYTPFFDLQQVQAVDPDVTVCADLGVCDVATIGEALSSVSAGQVVQVNTGYDPTGDSTMTFAVASTTLQCQSGVTIGTSGSLEDIDISQHGAVIQNCTFDRVNIDVIGSTTSSITGVTIDSNTFATTTAPSYIDFEQVRSSTISNNAGLGSIELDNVIGVTVDSNTIDLFADAPGMADSIVFCVTACVSTASTTNNTVSNNIITSYTDTWDGRTWIGADNGTNFTITSNTLKGDTVTTTGKTFMSLTNMTGEVSGNLIINTGTSGTGDTLISVGANTSTIATEVHIHNNTLISANKGNFVSIGNSNNASYDFIVTTTYNIFYSSAETATGTGMVYNNVNYSADITTSSQYNGYYNLSININEMTIDATSLTADPLFTNTTTYNAISPYSTYLDVDGTTDIGHIAGAFYGVTIAESGGSTAISEAGTVDTYTVVLTTLPSDTVTITMSSDAQVTTTPATLTFTTGNWNVAQTVTTTAIDDSDAEVYSHSGVVSHSISSGDSTYDSVPSISSVTATITDNDRTWTICASGCDYTTLTSAFASSSVIIGDTLSVSSTYSPTAETYPLTFSTTSLTVDCNNVGTVASSTYHASNSAINLTSSSTIQNCTLNNVNLTTANNTQTGVTITGNTSVTSTATTTIILASSAEITNLTVSNNTGLKNITLASSVGGSTYSFTSNTIYTDGANGILMSNGARSDVTISENTFYRTDGNTTLYFSNTTNLTIATNTLDYIQSATLGTLSAPLYLYGSNTTTLISGNYFKIPPGNQYGPQISAADANTIAVSFIYNTCDNLSDNGYCFAATATSTAQLSVTSTNNIFYSSSSTATGYGEIFTNYNSPTSNITAYISSNGYYNVKTNTATTSVNTWTDGGGHRTTKPWFRDQDTGTANDLYLAPHSLHCDDNMGAYSCTRATSTIAVDDDGTVDYSTLFQTGLNTTVTDNLKNDDTVTLAAGTYASTTLSSLTGLTVTGAGATTIFNAGSNEDAFTLSSVDSSTFSNFVVQNASSSANNYSMNNSNFRYSSTNYNNSLEDLGVDGSAFLTSQADCGAGVAFNGDGDYAFGDPNTILDGVTNINVALSQATGQLSIYALDSLISEAGDFECVTVDKFIDDVFTVSGGEYTYNAAAVAAAGATVVSGDSIPAITISSATAYAGIKLTNSDSNTFTNVTSTDNYYGVWFSGTSASNNISTSTFSSSDGYDIYADGSADNNIKNSVFNTASSSIASTGNVDVYYKARAYTTDGSVAIPTVSVTMTRADSGDTASLTTASDGYSPYTDFLLAYTMTSSTPNSTTSGGYNPWSVAAAATSAYDATTQSATLNTQNQTVTVTMTAAAVESSSPSGGGGGGAPAAPASPVAAAPAVMQVSIAPGDTSEVQVGDRTHKITPESPDSDGSVKMVIESEPITISLKAGEEQLLDTDTDGVDDLLVKLNSATKTLIMLSLTSVDDLEFSINQGASATDNTEVTLYFNSPDTVLVAVSDDSQFTGATFVPYAKIMKHHLSGGNGEKKVYAKFRTVLGGEKVMSDTIILTDQAFDQTGDDCPLTIGSAYKAENSAAVYYIDQAHYEDGTINTGVSCSKRPFSSAKKYFTYFNSWNDVNVVTQATLDSISDDILGFMPQGPHYDPKYGALVKVVTDARVYLLLGGNKHWITSEAVFTALGYAWDWIEDVSDSLLDKYTSKGEITFTDHHPNYTLVKYENSPKVYRLEPDPNDGAIQVKRWITDEDMFNSLHFRWDRIVTINDGEAYEDGEDL